MKRWHGFVPRITRLVSKDERASKGRSKTPKSAAAKLLAASVVTVVVASGCGGTVASDSIDAPTTSGSPTTGGSWDPQTLPPLVASTAGSGTPAAPVFSNSTVTDQQGLATSLQPTLQLSSATGAPTTALYNFTVNTIDTQSTVTECSGQSNSNSMKITSISCENGPTKGLQQGQIYQWSAQDTGTGTTYGPYPFVVDTWRSGEQPTQSFGPLSVDIATGAVTVASGLRSLAGASGSVGMNLLFRAGQASDAGLPAGWAMQGAGQSWDYLQVYQDTGQPNAVALVSVTGSVTAFQAGGHGTFSPLVPAGRPIPTGQTPTLVENDDQSWTVSMPSGTTTTFGPADPTTHIAQLTGSYNGTEAAPEYTYTNGKITAVTDSIASEMNVSLSYWGDATGCPQDIPAGFDSTSGDIDGLLCAMNYPDKSSTSFFYAEDGTGSPQLARIVDYPQTQDYKASVTDFAYDTVGHITSIRQPQAANVIAAAGQTVDGTLTTAITYDSDGRASLITKPAAVSGGVQQTYTIDYNPSSGTDSNGRAQGQTTVTEGAVGGPAPPKTTTSYDNQYTYDANTFLQDSLEDGSGNTSSDVWDYSIDQRQQSIGADGSITAYSYDPNTQNPTGFQGPYKKAPITGATPTESYSYDQDVSSGSATPMTGFNATYWENGTLTGGPSLRDFGPTVSGNIPGYVSWDWPSQPVGNAQPWSVRLSGYITIPSSSADSGGGKKNKGSKGKKDAPTTVGYTFDISDGSHLWIDNESCDACSLPLTPGASYPIRIDLGVTNENGGASGFTATWTETSVNNPQKIPMTAITPGYGLRSQTQTSDALAAKTPSQPNSYTQYDSPWNGQATSGWTDKFPTVKGKAQYEAYAPDPSNPDDGTYGRPTSSTLPAGNQSTYSYYSATQEADIPCSGMGNEPQHGLNKSTTRGVVNGANDPNDQGTQSYNNYYDDMGRVVATTVSDAKGSESDPTCSYYDDAGNLTKIVVPDRGSQPGYTDEFYQLVGGNPLQTQEIVTIGSTQYTASTTSDVLGRPVSTTDIWGTTQTYTYDPYNGKVQSVTATTASGKASTLASTYDGNGNLIQQTLDGEVVATVQPAVNGQSTVTYAHNVVENLSTSTQATSLGGFGMQQWTTSDGENFVYTNSKSPAQRVLTEQYAFNSDDPNAKFSYTYDAIGRLIGAELDTSLSGFAPKTTWSYGFGDPTATTGPGLNSNRLSMTLNGAETDYTYNAYDQLQSSTDPTLGNNIGYTSWGEMTNIGDLTIDYDASSLVTQIKDNAGDQVNYTRVGGALVQKDFTSNGTTATSLYSAGGFILDSNKNPVWQVIGLPGGATLVRDMSGNEQWEHTTARGQLMWVSDSNGQEIPGDRHLYSPFGEDLAPASAESHSASNNKYSQPSSAPSSSESASASASVSAQGSEPPASAAQHPIAQTSHLAQSPDQRSATASTSNTSSHSAPASASTSADPSKSKSQSESVSPTPTSTQSHGAGDPASPPQPNYQWQAAQGLETQSVGSVATIDMGQRLYIPALGRFTTPDPVNLGSANAYDYANQDPINQSDPSGDLPGWLACLLTVVVQIAADAAAEFLTDGLATFGISAQAAAAGSRVSYLAARVGIEAGTMFGVQAASQALLDPNGTPFYESWVNDAFSVVSLVGTFRKAQAAIEAASAGKTATVQAAEAAAKSSETVAPPRQGPVSAAGTGLSTSTTDSVSVGAVEVVPSVPVTPAAPGDALSGSGAPVRRQRFFVEDSDTKEDEGWGYITPEDAEELGIDLRTYTGRVLPNFRRRP